MITNNNNDTMYHNYQNEINKNMLDVLHLRHIDMTFCHLLLPQLKSLIDLYIKQKKKRFHRHDHDHNRNRNNNDNREEEIGINEESENDENNENENNEIDTNGIDRNSNNNSSNNNNNNDVNRTKIKNDQDIILLSSIHGIILLGSILRAFQLSLSSASSSSSSLSPPVPIMTPGARAVGTLAPTLPSIMINVPSKIKLYYIIIKMVISYLSLEVGVPIASILVKTRLLKSRMIKEKMVRLELIQLETEMEELLSMEEEGEEEEEEHSESNYIHNIGGGRGFNNKVKLKKRAIIMALIHQKKRKRKGLQRQIKIIQFLSALFNNYINPTLRLASYLSYLRESSLSLSSSPESPLSEQSTTLWGKTSAPDVASRLTGIEYIPLLKQVSVNNKNTSNKTVISSTRTINLLYAYRRFLWSNFTSMIRSFAVAFAISSNNDTNITNDTMNGNYNNDNVERVQSQRQLQRMFFSPILSIRQKNYLLLDRWNVRMQYLCYQYWRKLKRIRGGRKQKQNDFLLLQLWRSSWLQWIRQRLLLESTHNEDTNIYINDKYDGDHKQQHNIQNDSTTTK